MSTSERTSKIDEDFFRHHFSFYDPPFTEQLQDAIPFLLDECPVTHTDRYRGAWVISPYEEVVKALQDWRSFSSSLERSFTPLRPNQPAKPPIDMDPPLQRDFRRLLNPFLTPARVAPLEDEIRHLSTELIDEFIEDGRCELPSQFSKKLPATVLFRLIFDVAAADIPQVQQWVETIAYKPTDPATKDVEKSFIDWLYALIADRRENPKGDNLFDALLTTEIEGRPLTDLEVMGALYILVQGGFGTTSDTISSAMMRLADMPEAQARLREDPSLIPAAIEEVLRLEAPVTVRERAVAQDTEVLGREVCAGDRAILVLAAANRDPSEFPNPDQFDLDRESNRHLAFGLGPHRCIGSNVARVTARIALEELTSRLVGFRIPAGEAITREPAIGWGPTTLPLEFTRGPRKGAA